MGWIEKMQTYYLDNKDFLEIDISRGIRGAQNANVQY